MTKQPTLFDHQETTQEERDFLDYCHTDIGIKAMQYDKDNPDVYELFCKYAYQALKSGRKNYSANAIFEIIRWHTSIETKGDDFKISNNYRAYYARKLMALRKEFTGFFRIR